VTLTDPQMTRFVMTLSQAVRLVLESTFLARGGEVFVTKMPVMCIAELAEVMVEVLAERYGHRPDEIEVRVIGTKPGEKLFEELMSQEETRRTVELERYFVVLPAFKSVYHEIEYQYPDIMATTVARPYNSAVEAPMSREVLKSFLLENGLLDD